MFTIHYTDLRATTGTGHQQVPTLELAREVIGGMGGTIVAAIYTADGEFVEVH